MKMPGGYIGVLCCELFVVRHHFSITSSSSSDHPSFYLRNVTAYIPLPCNWKASFGPKEISIRSRGVEMRKQLCFPFLYPYTIQNIEILLLYFIFWCFHKNTDIFKTFQQNNIIFIEFDVLLHYNSYVWTFIGKHTHFPGVYIVHGLYTFLFFVFLCLPDGKFGVC